MAGTMCPLLHQRSSCFCEDGGRWGLLQDQSQPELRVPDDGGVERNFFKDIVYALGLDKRHRQTGLFTCRAFCSALQHWLATQPLGWGDAGEGMLSAICRRNTTNTHTRANGNSQQNKQREEGSGQECVDGRGGRERREGTCQGWAVAGLAALIKGQAGLLRAAR